MTQVHRLANKKLLVGDPLASISTDICTKEEESK
jgi:hypothetical protein